jgi:hypothetical protein
VTVELPLRPNLELQKDDFKSVLLDFDLARSVVLIGPSMSDARLITGFTFFPQGRAVAREGNGQIQGFVSDASGNPVRDAEVDLSTSGTVIATTATNGAGSYAFLEIAPGSFTVTAEKDDVAGISSTVVVQSNEVTPLNLTLNQPAPPPPSAR